jgi:hypothetical protein
MQLILSMFTYRIVTELGGFLVRQNRINENMLEIQEVNNRMLEVMDSRVRKLESLV